MTDDVTPALAALREFLAHTELPCGSTWASLRADLSFIVQAVADARRQAIEECARIADAEATRAQALASRYAREDAQVMTLMRASDSSMAGVIAAQIRALLPLSPVSDE